MDIDPRISIPDVTTHIRLIWAGAMRQFAWA